MNLIINTPCYYDYIMTFGQPLNNFLSYNFFIIIWHWVSRHSKSTTMPFSNSPIEIYKNVLTHIFKLIKLKLLLLL